MSNRTWFILFGIRTGMLLTWIFLYVVQEIEPGRKILAALIAVLDFCLLSGIIFHQKTGA